MWLFNTYLFRAPVLILAIVVWSSSSYIIYIVIVRMFYFPNSILTLLEVLLFGCELKHYSLMKNIFVCQVMQLTENRQNTQLILDAVKTSSFVEVQVFF